MAADRGCSAYIRGPARSSGVGSEAGRRRRKTTMGRRGPLVLQRIEDRRRRRICFRQRLAGMGKKAEELAVLCDAHVGLLVHSCSDGRLHHFAAPSTIENIMERYKNSLAAQQGVYDRGILKKGKSKDFHVPKELTEKGPGVDNKWSIDESELYKLNIDQLNQIERELEDELRCTRARKGKAAIAERSFMETTTRQPEVGGSRQSAEEGELVLSLSLSLSLNLGIGAADNDDAAAAAEQRHRTPFDLNAP